MNITFVNYHKFVDSSGIHIFFLANELEKLGVRCTVLVPDGVRSPHTFGNCLFKTESFWAGWKRCFSGSWGDVVPDIIHAWTPREKVRRLTVALSKRFDIPYCVHMEDNEVAILASVLGCGVNEVAEVSWLRLLRLSSSFIHPRRYTGFMECASGVSLIVDKLEEMVPLGSPSLLFYPACEEDFFDIHLNSSGAAKDAMGLDRDCFVVTYTGNIHQANAGEMSDLYESIGLLNKRGRRVCLLRTGSDHASLTHSAEAIRRDYVVELGSQPPSELLKCVACADALVQPGCPGRFNDYRFPSKLPMYLASGRPVILPRTNIGLKLEDGKECFLTESGSAVEIADLLERIMDNPGLASSVAEGGRSFARNNFSWSMAAKRMLAFYEGVCS